MQPLAATQRMMTWLSMCPADESSNERQKKAYVAHTLAVLFLNLIGFAASLVFCLQYVSLDFKGATFAFMTAAGEFGLIYFFIAAILMRYQIDSIFTSLSTIYKRHENEETFGYLAQANSTSEWMWTIYVKFVAISISGMVATSLLSVLHCYLTRGNFNVEHYYRPTNYVLPWNQTAAVGYFGQIIICIPVAYGYFILSGTPLLLFISLCLHHRAFYQMFKHNIVKSKKCDANLLCDLMRFHISAKDLFLDSANVYKSFVLVQLICSTVTMTVSVFYLDLQWHHFDLNVLSVTVATTVSISNLLLYCYFGELATESCEMMSDSVYNDMNWYEQPTKLQKHFILMIQNMQKPVQYHGFYVANLDLRTFIKLCKSVYSYYMVIKTLAAK